MHPLIPCYTAHMKQMIIFSILTIYSVLGALDNNTLDDYTSNTPLLLKHGIMNYFDCEGEIFKMKPGVGGEVALFLEEEMRILSIEHILNSNKYIDGDGTLFYNKGPLADFRIDGIYYKDCILR